MIRAACLLLAAACAAFAQLDDGTLTITATRSSNIQPDQAVLFVYANTPPTAALDDILAALTGTGITAANLNSVQSFSSAGSPQTVPTQWIFTLTIPFSRLQGTLAVLSQLQQSLDPKKLSLSFNVQGSQFSPELQAAQECVYPTLLGDAQAQARKVADAAGLKVGGILAMSDGGASTAAYRLGSFSAVLVSGLVSQWFSIPPPPPCTLTVQFTLLR